MCFVYGRSRFDVNCTVPAFMQICLSLLVTLEEDFNRNPLQPCGLKQIVMMNRAEKNVIEGMMQQL